MSKLDKIDYPKICDILFLVIIAAAVVHVVAVWLTGRSLWVDEAMLIKSVVTRDFAGICRGNLDYYQSAPVGYLLAVKAVVCALGDGELQLRLVSVLAYFGTVALTYLVARRTLGLRFPLMPTAFVAAYPTVLHFAFEAKPYMGEVFCGLAVVYLYTLYRSGRLSAWWTFAIISVSLWFAFGALFIIGAICIYHFINICVKLKRGHITAPAFWRQSLPLLLPAASVVLYYLLWVLPSTANTPPAEEDNYWTFLSFPLIPKGASDLRLLRLMAGEVFSRVGSYCIVAYGVGLLVTLVGRFRTWPVLCFLLSAVLVAVISSLGMYPISERLLLFEVVMCSLLAISGLDRLVQHLPQGCLGAAQAAIIAVLPVLLNSGDAFRMTDADRHRMRQEFVACREYVGSVRKPGSRIFVTSIQRPVAQYYTGYRMNTDRHDPRILVDDEYIWGSKFRDMRGTEPYQYRYELDSAAVMRNLAVIRRYPEVFVMAIHSENGTLDQFVGMAGQQGFNVETVATVYGSGIYRLTPAARAD